MMIGYQINDCIRQLLRSPSDIAYLGIFDAKKFAMPEKVNSNWLVVLNWDNEHWFCLFYSPGLEQVWFLDSLGRDCGKYSLHLSLELQEFVGAEKLLHLPFAVQPLHSQTCGFYIVFWANILKQGGSFRSLFSPFSPTKLGDNDRLVSDWIRQAFPYLDID